MEAEIKQDLTNLNNFLDNIESISKHPYANGVNIDKLIVDLKEYINSIISKIDKQEKEPVLDGVEQQIDKNE